MNNKKLLKPNSPLEMSVSEEESLKAELVTDTHDASLIAAMRENIDKRKKALAVVVDDKKIDSTKRIAEALVALDDVLLDEEVLTRVKDSIQSAYDYNMFTKASTDLYNRMMKQQLTTADPEVEEETVNSKINFFFKSGNTQLAVSVPTKKNDYD